MRGAVPEAEQRKPRAKQERDLPMEILTIVPFFDTAQQAYR